MIRHSVRTLMIGIGIFVSIAVFSTSGFSGTSRDQPSGEPPFGVAVQKDAQGIKLTGVLSIEYFNFSIDGSMADAKVVARLRKGNILKTFYATAQNVQVDNPSFNQAAITNLMKPQILDGFFPGVTGLNLILKSLEEFGEVDTPPSPVSSYVVADIVLAVK